MGGLDRGESMRSISERCGLSEEIVRRVQLAETEFIVDELKKGNRVNLPGRGTFRPELRKKLCIGGQFTNTIRATFKISTVILDKLEKCNSFEEFEETEETDELPAGIVSLQIPSLV